MAKKRKGGLGQGLNLSNITAPTPAVPENTQPSNQEVYEDRVFDKATNSWVSSPYTQYKPGAIKDQPKFETPKREPKPPQVERPPLPAIHDFSADHYDHYDVAEAFGIHPDTVYKLTSINKIPVTRTTGVGNLKRLWYKKDDIDFMRNNLKEDLRPEIDIESPNLGEVKKRGVFGLELQQKLKDRDKYNPIKTVNNVSTLFCDKCNEDVPISDAVMHEKAHKRGAM
jgi:hypothetical protein